MTGEIFPRKKIHPLIGSPSKKYFFPGQIGQAQGSQRPIICKISKKDSEWLDPCLVGRLNNSKTLEHLPALLGLDSILGVEIKYLGGLKVLIICQGFKVRDGLLFGQSEWFNQWFKWIYPWHDDLCTPDRLINIAIRGVPVLGWNEDTFEAIGRSVGEVVQVSEDTVNKVSLLSAQVQVLSQEWELINRTCVLRIDNKNYSIKISEDPMIEAVKHWEEKSDYLSAEEGQFSSKTSMYGSLAGCQYDVEDESVNSPYSNMDVTEEGRLSLTRKHNLLLEIAALNLDDSNLGCFANKVLTASGPSGNSHEVDPLRCLDPCKNSKLAIIPFDNSSLPPVPEASVKNSVANLEEEGLETLANFDSDHGPITIPFIPLSPSCGEKIGPSKKPRRRIMPLSLCDIGSHLVRRLYKGRSLAGNEKKKNKKPKKKISG